MKPGPRDPALPSRVFFISSVIKVEFTLKNTDHSHSLSPYAHAETHIIHIFLNK